MSTTQGEGFGMRVSLTHAVIGDLYLRNVTQIAWGYASPLPRKQVAIESDLHSTGVTYFCDQVERFEVLEEKELRPDFVEVNPACAEPEEEA